MNNTQMINESTYNKWSSYVTESAGVQAGTYKHDWITTMACYHELNESLGSANQYMHINPNANIGGMGEIQLPNNAFEPNGTVGSGDIPVSTLPIAVQVAAQTIALDLLPVFPMKASSTILQYVDYVYEGGKLNVTPYVNGKYQSNKLPKVIKANLYVDGLNINDQFGKGDVLSGFLTSEDYAPEIVAKNPDVAFRFVRNSFYDNKVILEVEQGDCDQIAIPGEEGALFVKFCVPTASNQTSANGLEGTANTKTVVIKDIETVKALEDFVPGYTGSDTNMADVANPWSRGEGEMTPANVMSLNTYTKDVKAKTIKVKSAMTREQIQDLSAQGQNPIAMIEATLIDELSQRINREILYKMWELGARNVKMAGNSATALTSLIDAVAHGETQGGVQRMILAKLLLASNLIAVRSRRSAGTFAVVSGKIASVIQNCAGFIGLPIANTINQQPGSIYPLGTVAGLSIYCDPLLDFDSNAIIVGRKGSHKDPGLVFMPYLLADKISFPSEGLEGAPVSILTSRYAIAEAGMHPETAYVAWTLNIADNFPLI